MPEITKQIEPEQQSLPWSVMAQHFMLLFAVVFFGFSLLTTPEDTLSDEFILTVSHTYSSKAKYICGGGECYALSHFPGDWNDYLQFFYSVQKGQQLNVRVNHLDQIATLSRDGVVLLSQQDYVQSLGEARAWWRDLSGGFLLAFAVLWLYRKMTD